MSSKLLALITFVIGIFIFCSIIFGSGTSNIIMATIFMISALLFTIKPDFYYEYLKFINPKLYENCSLKGEDNIRNVKKKTVGFLYMLSFVMYFNGFVNNSFSIGTTYYSGFNFYILFGILILFLAFGNSYLKTNLKSRMEKGRYKKISFLFGVYMTCMLITAAVVFWFIF